MEIAITIPVRYFYCNRQSWHHNRKKKYFSESFTDFISLCLFLLFRLWRSVWQHVSCVIFVIFSYSIILRMVNLNVLAYYISSSPWTIYSYVKYKRKSSLFYRTSSLVLLLQVWRLSKRLEIHLYIRMISHAVYD